MSISKRITSAALIVAVAVGTVTVGSSSAFAGSHTAVRACIWDIDRDYHPVRVLRVSPDGVGDYHIVLRDADGYIWDCNAGPDGFIHWNNVR